MKFAAVCALLFLLIMICIWLNLYFIVSGVGLAALMLFSVGASYVFFPRWLKCTVMWAPIAFLLDFGLSWGLTYGMGYSITGFTAAIVFGLLCTIFIKFERARLFNKWDGVV